MAYCILYVFLFLCLCFSASEQPLSFLVSRPSKSADSTVKKALSYREKKQAVKTQEEDKRRWERITILEVSTSCFHLKEFSWFTYELKQNFMKCERVRVNEIFFKYKVSTLVVFFLFFLTWIHYL